MICTLRGSPYKCSFVLEDFVGLFACGLSRICVRGRLGEIRYTYHKRPYRRRSKKYYPKKHDEVLL